MDDRFHKEDSSLDKSSASRKSPNNNPGSFSENIEAKKSADNNNNVSKKFEVHIADFDYVPDDELAAPATPAKKAAARTGATSSQSAKRRQTPAGQRGKSAASAKRKPTDKSNKPSRTTAPTNQAAKNSTSKTKKPPLSDAQKRKQARRRYNTLKNLLISCVCIIFITIITTTVSSVALGFLNDILVISDKSNYTAVVEIPEGATYDDVFTELCDNGLVRQPFLTDFFLRFRHYDQYEYKDSKTGELKVKVIEYEAGKYFLESTDGVENMIESIMVKNNYSKDTVRLTFPEGWTIAQIFEKLEKYEVCEANQLYANLDIVAEQYGFISDIKADSGRYLLAEGYLFPDTYDFFVGESASSVLKKLFNNFSNRWAEDYDDQLKTLGMTKDEIITIASIIQREAKDGSQMKDISAVIHNRLKDATNFPNIQMNSTTDYITNLKPFNVFSESYYTIYLEQYNTYSNEGLPPGPICSPGKKAIQAALYPSDAEYMFFCHDTDGNVYYAVTAQEHAENTSKVLYGDITQ